MWREFVEFFAQEWAVIRGARVTFLVAIGLVCVVVYLVVDKTYSVRLENQASISLTQAATIASLQGQTKIKDEEIARNIASSGEVRRRIEGIDKGGARDPDGIYQFGSKVAVFEGSSIDLISGSVIANTMRYTDNFNGEAEADYRDFVIRCSGMMPRRPEGSISGTRSGLVRGAKCLIVRQRS